MFRYPFHKTINYIYSLRQTAQNTKKMKQSPTFQMLFNITKYCKEIFKKWHATDKCMYTVKCPVYTSTCFLLTEFVSGLFLRN